MFTFRHIKAHLAFYLQLYGNRVLEKGFIGLVVGFFVFLFSLALVVSNFGVEWGFLRSLILMCWVLSPILCGVGCKTLI